MPRFIPIIHRSGYKAAILTFVVVVATSLIVLRVTYSDIGLPFIQSVLIALIFPILFGALQPGLKWLELAESVIARTARNRRVSVTAVGIFALILSAGLTFIAGIPEPNVHDEFSYLLAGDTFAHGRLRNPVHPMWVHFESYHIIQQPHYASKYPPAQGLMLALGQTIGGRPIVGVWLSTALACAAVCWMLFAWISPRWALFGGMLIVLHPIVLGWSQNYWGGAVAMCGGALLLGAFRRVARRPRAGDAILLGLGLTILANSRPYEGFVIAVVLTSALGARIVFKRMSIARVLRLIVVPLSTVLILAALMMAYYNQRVSDNALRMPYMVHEATYAVVPNFLFQRLQPEPTYNHSEFRRFFVGYVAPIYTSQRSIGGLLLSSMGKLLVLAFACFWLLVPPMWLWAEPSVLKRDRSLRLALAICAIFVAALLLEIWIWPHYASPAAGLAIVISLRSMRHLRSRRFGGAIGQFVLRATLALCIISFVIFCLRAIQYDRSGWNYQRAEMIAHLKEDGERHLVVVRYGPDHNVHQEWVYNDADIDGAPVIWAREMDRSQNRKLLEYFKDRRVWLLEADADKPMLAPYPSD